MLAQVLRWSAISSKPQGERADVDAASLLISSASKPEWGGTERGQQANLDGKSNLLQNVDVGSCTNTNMKTKPRTPSPSLNKLGAPRADKCCVK